VSTTSVAVARVVYEISTRYKNTTSIVRSPNMRNELKCEENMRHWVSTKEMFYEMHKIR